MQKGFATLEIILVLLIIGLLMSVAIPNAQRAIDRAALDYETKNLYSDLRYLQSISRSGKFLNLGMGERSFSFGDNPYMQISTEYNTYQLLRGNVPIRETHRMQNGISITTNFSKKDTIIIFDSTGKATNAGGSALSGTITLTSRYGKPETIVFDSVGRIRGGRDQ